MVVQVVEVALLAALLMMVQLMVVVVVVVPSVLAFVVVVVVVVVVVLVAVVVAMVPLTVRACRIYEQICLGNCRSSQIQLRSTSEPCIKVPLLLEP